MKTQASPVAVAFTISVIMTANSLVQGQPELKRGVTGSSTTPLTAGAPFKSTTVVEIKLLAGPEGGLHSQQWAQLLEPLDVSLQIQRATGSDKIEVRDREVGTIRYVTAVGTLDRTGKISFPGHVFEQSDGPKLREWIAELKTYGAQGSPEGQPMWGMTKPQFTRFYDSLLKRVEVDVREPSLRKAIASLPLPNQYPVRWSSAANEMISRPGGKNRARQDVRGMSAATALAISLNDCGLGFRPNRTAADGIEIVIEPLGLRKDQWPIGWPLQQQRIKAAPKLFSMTSIELDQVELTDLLTAVTELTETPILIDYYEIERSGIDLKKLSVSFKKAQTSWSVALKTMVIPKKLTREIWQDEAGRTFVWISVNRPGRSGAQADQ